MTFNYNYHQIQYIAYVFSENFVFVAGENIQRVPTKYHCQIQIRVQ